MSMTTDRKISTLNTAEGVCEDVLEFEHKNKDGEVTYRGHKLILKTDSQQYFEIEAKADEDMPLPDQLIVCQWWCNGRRWRKTEADDWRYFTSLKLRSWERCGEGEANVSGNANVSGEADSSGEAPF